MMSQAPAQKADMQSLLAQLTSLTEQQTPVVETPKPPVPDPFAQLMALAREQQRSQGASTSSAPAIPSSTDSVKMFTDLLGGFSVPVAEEPKKAANELRAEYQKYAAVTIDLKNRRQIVLDSTQRLEEELVQLKRQHGELSRRRKGGLGDDQVLVTNTQLQKQIEEQIVTIGSTATQLDRTIVEREETFKKLSGELKVKVEEEKVKTETMPLQQAAPSPSAARSPSNGRRPPRRSRSPAKRARSRSPRNRPSKRPRSHSRERSDSRGGRSAEKPRRKASPDVYYDYYDAGTHWCGVCCSTHSSVGLLLQHLQSPEHTAAVILKNVPSPLASIAESRVVRRVMPSGTTKPFRTDIVSIKGAEFLSPTNGFFCALCDCFAGDREMALLHIKSDMHRHAYNTYVEEHNDYEKELGVKRAQNSTPYAYGMTNASLSSVIQSMQNPPMSTSNMDIGRPTAAAGAMGSGVKFVVRSAVNSPPMPPTASPHLLPPMSASGTTLPHFSHPPPIATVPISMTFSSATQQTRTVMTRGGGGGLSREDPNVAVQLSEAFSRHLAKKGTEHDIQLLREHGRLASQQRPAYSAPRENSGRRRDDGQYGRNQF